MSGGKQKNYRTSELLPLEDLPSPSRGPPFPLGDEFSNTERNTRAQPLAQQTALTGSNLRTQEHCVYKDGYCSPLSQLKRETRESPSTEACDTAATSWHVEGRTCPQQCCEPQRGQQVGGGGAAHKQQLLLRRKTESLMGWRLLAHCVPFHMVATTKNTITHFKFYMN